MVNTNEKFREIYEKYKNLILKIAYDITKDYHLSQDICQKTFEKLYGYQNHVDEDRVKSWLIVVASNEARDYCRKGGNYSVLLSGTAELDYLMENENCIELHIEREAKRELLGRMMDGLKKAGVEVNRKVLADLAVNDPQAFAGFAKIAKENLK